VNKEKAIEYGFLLSALVSVIGVLLILAYVGYEGSALFARVPITDFLFSFDWEPTKGHFGALALIVGSILVTFCAVLIGTPLALAAAIFLSELATPRMQRLFRPAIELLAGIPSVVYGFFGIVTIVPLVRTTIGGAGFGLVSGSLVLAVMIVPVIAMLSEDALTAVPDRYRYGSLALGATKWETIVHVLLPTARQGIVSAIILGVGRAIGETMAVLMVLGNAPIVPQSLKDPLATMTSVIAMDISYAEGDHRAALFALGLLLLLVSMSLVGLVRAVSARRAARGGRS
jgi:phosphate transport system permease protein